MPHTLETYRNTHARSDAQVGGTEAAAADGETILATLKHGGRTRLHGVKTVRERQRKVLTAGWDNNRPRRKEMLAKTIQQI